MFTIELLPAAHGDAIWIEYGAAGAEKRILMDGGPAPTYEEGLRRRIAAVPETERAFELMVVTHIDADHIDGSLILLQELDALQVRIQELWFNGWSQLVDADKELPSFAPMQGEFLGGLIQMKPALNSAWNAHFDHRAVAVVDQGPLPEMILAGSAKLTLLGPTQAELVRLRKRWVSAIRDFSPGDTHEALMRLSERREYIPPPLPLAFATPQFGDDRSPANGSSIACVLEYAGAAILLTGDAHARSLEMSLKRLADSRSVNRLHFDAVKLPHHGSMSNVSEGWLRFIDCKNWLLSTNGAIFNHPDPQTAGLIADIHPMPTFFCNYAVIADRLAKQAGGRWKTVAPEGGKPGIHLDISAG